MISVSNRHRAIQKDGVLNVQFVPMERSSLAKRGSMMCLACEEDLGVCSKSSAYRHGRSVHHGMKVHVFTPFTAAEIQRFAASRQRSTASRRYKRQQLKVGE
jgi:hypothetical protein